jgi:hypothetical protein
MTLSPDFMGGETPRHSVSREGIENEMCHKENNQISETLRKDKKVIMKTNA